ncbi:hypothetical protein GCM10010521_51080 [Streptomyces rameus]|uniref:Uncharacterized protein n=1 Tax=Streptomyces rameus TaxID=68261 RepID=A0ABP6NX73_9ACTN
MTCERYRLFRWSPRPGAHAPGAALGAAVVAGNRRPGPLVHAVAVVAGAVSGDRGTAWARSP